MANNFLFLRVSHKKVRFTVVHTVRRANVFKETGWLIEKCQHLGHISCRYLAQVFYKPKSELLCPVSDVNTAASTMATLIGQNMQEKTTTKKTILKAGDAQWVKCVMWSGRDCLHLDVWMSEWKYTKCQMWPIANNLSVRASTHDEKRMKEHWRQLTPTILFECW